MGYSLNQRGEYRTYRTELSQLTTHITGLFKDVIRDRKTGVKYTQGTRIACKCAAKCLLRYTLITLATARREEDIFAVLGTTWR